MEMFYSQTVAHMGLGLSALFFRDLGFAHHPDGPLPSASQPDGSAGSAGGHDRATSSIFRAAQEPPGSGSRANHTYLPLKRREADHRAAVSVLLLDSTGFESRKTYFTRSFRRERYRMKTARARTVAHRPSPGTLVVEPSPATHRSNDPRAFIDVFTDIAGLS